MAHRRSELGLLLLLLGAVALPGCASSLGAAIASTPNRHNPFAGRIPLNPVVRDYLGVTEQFFVDVGPPDARLSVSIVDPDPAAGPPLATIMFLHGIHNRSYWLLDGARNAAAAGYRAVLVDLRGHGRSSGTLLSFGPREADDLVQVIDELERRELIAGRLGVYGVSYGATTAIHLAARDPRVSAVVSVAPFNTMREEVPHYIRTVLPGVEKFLSDEAIQAAIDSAGQQGQFDPDAASAELAIQDVRAPVLLVHGTDDRLVPHEQSLQLVRAAPGRTQLQLVEGAGHMNIWRDDRWDVGLKARQWFDLYLCGIEPRPATIAPAANDPAPAAQ